MTAEEKKMLEEFYLQNFNLYIACYLSPKIITLAGRKEDIDRFIEVTRK